MRSNLLAGEASVSPALLAVLGPSALHAAGSRLSGDPGSPVSYESEDPDQDDGDLPQGVDEDALDADDLDTDQIASPS